MSGRMCFICREPNWNGNETLVTVRRTEVDADKPGERTTRMWSGMVCDRCLEKHLGILFERSSK